MDRTSVGVSRYMVVAYRGAAAVCEVASTGAVGLNGPQAVYFARELRVEFPDAVVAILPRS